MSGDAVGIKFLEGAAAFADVSSAYTKASGERTAALYDAAAAEAEAADARNRGATASARQLARTARQVGRVKAQIAGRGFATGSGTAVDLQDATDFIGRLDAMTIRDNAEKEVLSKRLAAQGARLRADSISPGGEAVGTLIGQSGLLARRWSSENSRDERTY